MNVGEYVKTKCETSGLAGLSKQIATSLMHQVSAAAVMDITAHVIVVGSSTIPYLQSDAGRALAAAVKEHGSKPRLVHALRVLPQQYAVSQWYLQHRCDIPLAAIPGTSPHEMGIAIDIENHDEWINVLRQHNWQWRGKSDPAHFNYHGHSDPDFTRWNVMAFQRLWDSRTANPQQHLTADGVPGPKTIARLEASPAAGFAG
jgi:hypothetical protein